MTLSRPYLCEIPSPGVNGLPARRTIHEKYNMVTRSSDDQMNAIGFGWTDGVFLALLDKLLNNEHLISIRFLVINVKRSKPRYPHGL